MIGRIWPAGQMDLSQPGGRSGLVHPSLCESASVGATLRRSALPWRRARKIILSEDIMSEIGAKLPLFLFSVGALVFLSLGPSRMSAQVVKGSISGTVGDPSGAVVP